MRNLCTMSMKILLGLNGFNLSEQEIVTAIANARCKGQEEVVFRSNSQKVVVKLAQVNPQGVMRSTWNSWR